MELRDPNSASSFPGNDWHRRLFELAPDALLVTRLRDGQIVDMNARFLETMGYSREELIGRTPLDLGSWVYPEDREVLVTLLREGRGLCSGFETTLRNKQGCEIPVLMSARVTEIDGEAYVVTDITGLRRVEEELKASEEKYRLVVENANEAIFIAQEGLLKLVNPKALEVTGYDQETIQTKPFPELIHPEDRAMVMDRHLRRARGEDLPSVYSFRIVDGEGRVKWVEINAVRMDWEGRPATLNFLSDITDRRSAEEALRESEERARLIFNTVPDSITITRVEDGRYILVNDYFCRLTGFLREETIGRTVSDLNVFVNVQDRERFIREMRGKGEITNFEIQYRKKDGSQFTSLLSARPIQYAGEDCLVAVVADISNRKQIEDALRQSEEKQRQLVESMREGFGVLNERNEVTYINKRFCELIGFRPEEIIGRPVTDFVNQENLKILREQGGRRRKGEKGPYEVAWTRKDGQPVYTLMSPEPVFDEQGNFKGSFAVITDISERKQMEEALRKSEERYRLLVDNANEAILVIQGGMITFVNPQAIKIMNIEGHALTPQPFLDFIHPEDRETVLQRYQERLAGKCPRPGILFAWSIKRGKPSGWKSTPSRSPGKGSRPPWCF